MDTSYYQNIVNALPHSALIIDSNLNILCANGHAEKLFDRDLSGVGFVRVLRQPEALQCVSGALDSGEYRSCNLILRLNTARTYLASAGMLSDEAFEKRLLFTLTDISAEIAAEKSRSTFVANVSHELRSPLTSLMGVVETLKGPARKDEAARDRFLDLMQGETDRMSRLVGDLLSLAKLEAKEHVAPDGEVDVSRVIQRIVAVLEEGNPLYKGRVELIEGADLLPIKGDRDELTEVFQNLIENALKYSAPDTPVTVEITNKTKSMRWLRVIINDRGEGIAPEHLPRLTERFYRVDKGRSREMGGTGLGLAISKHILNRHRGRLAIDSEIGQGTSVSVSLPL